MPTHPAAQILLRPIDVADLDYLWTWQHGVADTEWKRWDAPYFHTGQRPPSRADFTAEQMARLGGAQRRMIDVDGERLGIVTRWEEEPAGGGWWELGIVIFDPCHWGSGLGRQVLEKWRDSTFAETGAHVVTVTTWSGNERMIRSAKRVGFTECARIPGARLWGGRRWDSVKLAMLRSSLEGRPPTPSVTLRPLEMAASDGIRVDAEEC